MPWSSAIIVSIVFIFVAKPEDIKFILQKTRLIVEYLSEFKREIISHLNIDVTNNKAELNPSPSKYLNDVACDIEDEMQFYLQKIINITGYYEGDYTLQQVKLQYQKLMKLKIEEETNKQQSEQWIHKI